MEYITKVIPTFTKLVSGLQSYFNPKQSGFASRMINAGIVLFIYIISNFIWTLLDNILFFVLFYKTVNYLHSMKQNTTICDASGVTPILEGWLVYGALSLFFNVLYYLTSFIGFGFILIPIKLMVGYKLLNDESLFGWISSIAKKIYQTNKTGFDAIFIYVSTYANNTFGIVNTVKAIEMAEKIVEEVEEIVQ